MGFLVKKVSTTAPAREAPRWVTCGECNGRRVVATEVRENPDSSFVLKSTITCPSCGGRGRVRQ